MKFDLLRSRVNAARKELPGKRRRSINHWIVSKKLIGGEDEDGRTLTGMELALCGGVRELCAGHGPASAG